MRQLFTILFVITNFVSFGQNKYTDWFDLGLKGKPISLKEIEIFSLSNFLEPNMSFYYNSTVKSSVFVKEYYFDTFGLISKLYKKDIIDTSGRWFDLSTGKIEHYKDSIIITEKEGWWKEKRFLDKNEFLKTKIVGPLGYDTMVFERDSNDRIIKEYRHFYSVDFGKIIKTSYELNDKGDVVLEKKMIKSFNVNYDEPSINDNITNYQYFYDIKNNWILRISIIDNKVSTITQRTIQYE